jgi:hypothetical protein
MTVAVCFHCGAFKFGAFTACECCGAQPEDLEDLAVSHAITDHHYEKAELDYIANRIKAGANPQVDPALVQRLKGMMASPVGQKMLAMFGKKFEPRGGPFNNTAAIAKRLVSMELAVGGCVRMNANPFQVAAALRALKELGFSKPFFANGKQFIYDTVLRHDLAMARLLPSSLLAGPENSRGLIECWAGSGPYIGRQGLLQLGNFASGGKEKVVLVILIEPYFDALSDLLGRITENV